MGGRVIGAVEFRNLLISHRRMVRVDRRAEHVRGLQDLDTGEVFLTDPHWGPRALLPARKSPPGIPLAAVPPHACALLSHNHYDHLDAWIPRLGSVSRATPSGPRSRWSQPC